MGAMLLVAGLAGGYALMAQAEQCETRYRTECVKEDDAGRCIKYERVAYDVCTPDKDPIKVSPPKSECFECYEYNSDGSCKKTRKVTC